MLSSRVTVRICVRFNHWHDLEYCREKRPVENIEMMSFMYKNQNKTLKRRGALTGIFYFVKVYYYNLPPGGFEILKLKSNYN
jgi:hypothetical protein